MDRFIDFIPNTLQAAAARERESSDKYEDMEDSVKTLKSQVAKIISAVVEAQGEIECLESQVEKLISGLADAQEEIARLKDTAHRKRRATDDEDHGTPGDYKRVKAPTSNHPEDKPLGKGTDVEDEEGGYEEDGTDDDTEDDEVIDEKPLSLREADGWDQTGAWGETVFDYLASYTCGGGDNVGVGSPLSLNAQAVLPGPDVLATHYVELGTLNLTKTLLFHFASPSPPRPPRIGPEP